MRKNTSSLLSFLWQFLVSGLLFSSSALAGSVSFTYNLPSASTTSAGVYKTDGTLVRTLWNNVAYPAGANQGTWDGLDDNAQPMPAQTYQVRILAHNATYTWEGYIGNTSSLQTGTTVYRSFDRLFDMAITANDIYTVDGYNEGAPFWARFAISNPNSVAAWGLGDYKRLMTYAATDGVMVYFALQSTSQLTTYPSFVTAIDVSTGNAHLFSAPNGITTPTSGTPQWNAIGYMEGQSNNITGLAVQKNGPYLFIARSALNSISVLNKTTGAPVSTASVTAPGRIGTTDDGHLWAICTEGGNRVVRRYDVSGAGVLSSPGAVITGLANPLAVAVTPDNSKVVVADGGTSQQVKAFTNISNGTPSLSWTLGLAGGYNATNGPNVTNTKFCFMRSISTDGTFIAFQADGSFWLADGGNERYLHFSANQTYLGQIAYISANYVAPICAADPTRVFAKGWLEYSVNYSQPAATGWTLVKNWRAGLPDEYTPGVASTDGLHAVVKLSNGRTYGVAAKNTSERWLMELPASGAANPDTALDVGGKTFHEDGSLRWRVVAANTTTFWQNSLTGFDASNNPTWGPSTALAIVPMSSVDPVGNGGYTGTFGTRSPITTGNVLISANPSGANWTYHLGGIKLGTNDWLWKAAPAGIYYDLHGTVGDSTYPCNSHFAEGHNIVLNCHGEGYQGAQADQYLHYWDNGLMVGEFGKNLSEGTPPPNTVVAGRAGNAVSSSLVQYGADLYLWANDEWGTGMHRWKIANSSGITELTPINVTLTSTGGSGEGLTGEYFTGINFDTLTTVLTDPSVNFTWSGVPISGVPSDNFSVRWSGLVQPTNSETYTFYTQSDAGVRLWVNGQKIIDNWTAHASVENASTPVSLSAGQRYKIVLEYYDTTGTAVAQLKWSSASQTKQIIPMQQLYPSDAIAIHCGGVAIGRFKQDPLGISGTNIVTTSNAIDLSGAVDPAPMAVYQTQRKSFCTYIFQDLKPFTNYKVRVHVAELTASAAVGARVFPITVNVIDDITPLIDPYAMAGAKFKAAIREFTVTTDNTGLINLRFWSANNTLIAALEVERDPSDAATNPCFSLIGLGGGLQGSYYSGTAFNTLISARIDREVNFLWGTGNPATGVGPTNYTVRWDGRLLSHEAGSHEFSVNATAGARLWVNNQLVIDSWSASGTHTGTINLGTSALYDIKLEYLNTTGSSVVILRWKRPADSIFDVIPQSQLYPPVQTTPVSYSITGGSLAPATDSHFTATNMTRGSALTLPASFTTNWAYAPGDKTASSETAALTGSYFAFTLTPNAGTTYSLTSLTFDAAFYESTGAANTAYTTNYFVRSSLDNYATTIGSVIPEPGQTATNPVFHARSVTLGTAFSGLTGPVTFRVYIYDSITGATRLSAIDNLTLNGSAAP